MSTIRFSTGKEMNFYCGFVGLNPEFEISQGFDGLVYPYEDNSIDEPTDSWLLNKTEQLELCDIMIKRWSEFKASL